MKKKNDTQQEDTFELSDEMMDIEDSLSIAELQKKATAEKEYVPDGALYTDEELEQIFDNSSPAQLTDPITDIVQPVITEALYSSDEDLKKAVDAIDERKEHVAPEPDDTAAPLTAESHSQSIQSTQTSPAPGHTKAPVRISLKPFLDALQKSVESSDADGDAVLPNGFSAPCEPFLMTDIEAKEFVCKPDDEEISASSADDNKSTYQKATAKAKLLFNRNKAQLDEYLGRTLPERTLPLDFHFQNLKSKKDLDSIVSTRTIRLLFSSRGKSLHSQFKQAEHDLDNIARCKLSKAHKQSLLDVYSDELFDKCHQIISQFEKRPSVHKDPKRLEIATLAYAAIKHLINGYKQLYAEIYQSSNLLYGPQRSSANALASRLTDWLCMEQLLLCAVHMPISALSIKSINKLLHAIALYEPELLTEVQTFSSWPHLDTLQSLFLMYQLLLCSGYQQLSTSEHGTLKSYLSENLHALKIIELEAACNAGEQVWIINHDLSDAPLIHAPLIHTPLTEKSAALNKLLDDAYPPIVIQVSHLFNNIIADYAVLLDQTTGHDVPPQSSTLRALSSSRRLNFLDTLNQQIALNKQGKRRPCFTLFKPVNLCAYSGITDALAFLNCAWAIQEKDNIPKERYDELTTTKPKGSSSEWFCALEDEQNLYLQTIEEKAGIELDAGQLLLLLISNEEEKCIQLITIDSLERPLPGRITVVGKKLGKLAASVLADSENSPCCRAIIALTDAQLCLITEANAIKTSDHTIELKLPDNSTRRSVLTACLTDTAYVQARLLRS